MARLVVEADGGSRGNPGPAAWGALVRDAASGRVLAERAGYLGVATNNVAEYTGLVEGLRAAVAIDPDAELEVRMDSRLVVEQMSGRWQVRHEDMRRLVAQARDVVPPGRVRYVWVERARNAAADALVNEALDARADVARDRAELAEVTHRPPLRVRRPSGAAMRFDDDEPLTVVLLRHGETAMTASKAYSGSGVPGPPLSPTGRIQAAQAADLVFRIGRDVWDDLPHPRRLLASPMVRTQETARAVGRRIGATVETEPGFAECDFGAWEGRTAAQIEDGWPGQLRRWHTDAAFPAPGGESIEDVGRRVRAALDGLLAQGVDRTVVVVSHSVAIRAAIGVTLGAPSSVWAAVRVAPASVSILRLWEDGQREVAVVGMPTDL